MKAVPLHQVVDATGEVFFDSPVGSEILAAVVTNTSGFAVTLTLKEGSASGVVRFVIYVPNNTTLPLQLGGARFGKVFAVADAHSVDLTLVALAQG